LITNPLPQNQPAPQIINTALYTQLEAAGALPNPNGNSGNTTGTLTEQQLIALIEQKAKEILGSAVDAQRSFGFQAGENYYSPISYWWADYYNRQNSKWAKTLKFGETLGIVILNKSSGDWGTGVDQDFLTQGKLAEAAGAKLVAFYIKTRFGANSKYATEQYRARIQKSLNVPMEQVTKFTQDYVIQTAKNVIAWYKGQSKIANVAIFLDEVVNGWDAEQQAVMPYYIELYKLLRAELGADVPIIINPGSNTRLEMMSACDIAVTYESDATKYLSRTRQEIHPDQYQGLPSWRFWHIVHGITKENVDRVCEKADDIDVGHLYLTDQTFAVGTGSEDTPQEDPYDDPPSPWVVPKIRSWIKGVLPLEQRLSAVEAKVAAKEN
jgi:hypothetical protein